MQSQLGVVRWVHRFEIAVEDLFDHPAVSDFCAPSKVSRHKRAHYVRRNTLPTAMKVRLDTHLFQKRFANARFTQDFVERRIEPVARVKGSQSRVALPGRLNVGASIVDVLK